MKKDFHQFDKYSSKTKRVNIPVPTFDLVGRSDGTYAKAPETRHKYLIGRDRITERFHTWIGGKNEDGGSYLITGYRGMGKTCFVNRVLDELIREPYTWENIVGIAFFLSIIGGFVCLYSFVIATILAFVLYRWIYLRYKKEENDRRKFFLKKAQDRYRRKHSCRKSADMRLSQETSCLKIKTGLEEKEWERINRFLHNETYRHKSFDRISVNVNLGQEILDEREILCVLASQLYSKYRHFVLSPISNVRMWGLYSIFVPFSYILLRRLSVILLPGSLEHWLYALLPFVLAFLLSIILFYAIKSHPFGILHQLKILSKRINAALTQETGIKAGYHGSSVNSGQSYNYPIATTREIESQLTDILERISKTMGHPQIFFVFDELDKIEVPYKADNEFQPEFSNERYLSGGGTSRKRKTTVLHLLGNLKFFTSTAKAKFIFIAGREMYDAYLADMTDRESAISSLFNGIIYVESFCKNEKSEKDVLYNAETFIVRQLIPYSYIEEKVLDRYIECKLNGEIYTNIDINLKLYYEYLTISYSSALLKDKVEDGEGSHSKNEDDSILIFNDVRDAIDKVMVLLYHFTFYLYHISNGSPKKMRLNFENFIRPIKDPDAFFLFKGKVESPLEKGDLDIHITARCHNLLSFGEKEQRVIGFVHYISFPVNQVFTDANQYGDKLLVSASFLINHIYKYHSGGFSWRNIEQTPELLEVYRIPEFRSFIDSILNFLLQTHIIKIPCGLYQYKFRKHIAEEISLASKISEEISAIFNFALDESQAVKHHYLELRKKHVEALNDEKSSSPHSITGIHHILGDLYMADEEYNNAIFEYQAALSIISPSLRKKDNGDSCDPSIMLAYIRYMLKLGAAYEKRRTYSSAYNTYFEIINQLFHFREFKENEFGLDYCVQKKLEWPHYMAVLYIQGKGGNLTDTAAWKIGPAVLDVIPDSLTYKTTGDKLISDFSYLMTPKKHMAVQRLSMLEDTQIIYQALLAKLFVIEKMELGGITRSHLNIIEGEFQYLHLATNDAEKFLISTDFFRRLGDIMYYKNGLIGFGFEHRNTGDRHSGKIEELFINGLYYWGIDIETEIQNFCRERQCFEHYDGILKDMRYWHTRRFNPDMELTMDFLKSEDLWNKVSKYVSDIDSCNKRRCELWRKNRNVPCFACKYYNRSLRILMSNLFGIDIEEEKGKGNGIKSKTVIILRKIIEGGSAKTMRQNHMIQMAELLDCLGNSMLSCADITDAKKGISGLFLSLFLHDANIMNESLDKENQADRYWLLRGRKFLVGKKERETKEEEEKDGLKLSKIETCLLYYWEAFICFRYGNEQKKAAESIKKILRVFQNYLKVSEIIVGSEELGKKEKELILKRKIVIGEFLNEIKNRLVKQSLICLYSHYNFINLMEIQRLKWIFYTQMYENISLNRLSLFPDVEEILLTYYDLIRLCIVEPGVKNADNRKKKDYETLLDEKDISDCIEKIRREYIEKYSRNDPNSGGNSSKHINYTWEGIKKRNQDFTNRLIGIYNNISMSALSHHHSIYERILTLNFKATLNQHILELIFPEMRGITGHDQECIYRYIDIFNEYFSLDNLVLAKRGEELWKRFFHHIRFRNDGFVCTKSSCKNAELIKQTKDEWEIRKKKFVENRLQVLEYLIRDSVYCLTEILETITPYTSTTLFTSSFMGSVYDSLHKWNIRFDALFKYYKMFDSLENSGKQSDSKLEEEWRQIEYEYEKYDKTLPYGCKGMNGVPSCSQVLTDDIDCAYFERVRYNENIPKKSRKESVKGNDFQMKWQSVCPFYHVAQCQYKPSGLQMERGIVFGLGEKEEKKELLNLFRRIWNCNNVSDRFFESVISTIDKPNIHYTLSNYSMEMALKSYRSTIEMHREGKDYKNMISKMHYLDDDLKNDTVQFDLAVERFKINNGFIRMKITDLMRFGSNSLYDIEKYCTDNESRLPLHCRFMDLILNTYNPQ